MLFVDNYAYTRSRTNNTSGRHVGFWFLIAGRSADSTVDINSKWRLSLTTLFLVEPLVEEGVLDSLNGC